AYIGTPAAEYLSCLCLGHPFLCARVNLAEFEQRPRKCRKVIYHVPIMFTFVRLPQCLVALRRPLRSFSGMRKLKNTVPELPSNNGLSVQNWALIAAELFSLLSCPHARRQRFRFSN